MIRVVTKHSLDIAKDLSFLQWLVFMVIFKVIVKYESRPDREPAFCIWENKYADQLRSNCEVDLCLCFRYLNTCSTISLLTKSEISCL